jgi:hypothetical protein
MAMTQKLQHLALLVLTSCEHLEAAAEADLGPVLTND